MKWVAWATATKMELAWRSRHWNKLISLLVFDCLRKERCEIVCRWGVTQDRCRLHHRIMFVLSRKLVLNAYINVRCRVAIEHNSLEFPRSETSSVSLMRLVIETSRHNLLFGLLAFYSLELWAASITFELPKKENHLKASHSFVLHSIKKLRRKLLRFKVEKRVIYWAGEHFIMYWHPWNSITLRLACVYVYL